MILGGIRSVPSKFSENEITIITDSTSFLDNPTFSERCFNIINDLDSKTYCKNCSINETKFLRISSGYRTFCSNSCKNKWIHAHTNLRQVISESLSAYHKTLPINEREKQQNKRFSTMVLRGIITEPSERDNFYNYYLDVWKYTNKNNLKSLEHFEKRGRSDVVGAYQLDHMYSIANGFINNVHPSVIGSMYNLKMIPAKENNSKKEKCSITLTELIEKIEKYK